MTGRTSGIGWAAGLLIATAVCAGGAESGVDRVVEGLQGWLDGTRTLEGRFRQTLESGAFGSGIEERGRLFVDRPGRIRWDYLEPEVKTALILGTRTLLYLPEDRQLIRGEIDPRNAFLPALLAGRNKVSDLFLADVVPGDADRGAARLRLVPRSEDGSVAEAILTLDRASYAISEAEIVDAAGNRTRFRFDGWKRNRKLEDGLFAFEPPAGTEIVEAD